MFPDCFVTHVAGLYPPSAPAAAEEVGILSAGAADRVDGGFRFTSVSHAVGELGVRPHVGLRNLAEVSMWEKLTKHCLIAIEDARTEARHLGHAEIEPEHLLLALLRDANQAANPRWGSHAQVQVATRILRDLHAPMDQLRALLLECLPPSGQGAEASEGISQASKDVIEAAWDEAQSLDGAYVGTEHLLLALLRAASGPSKVLSAVGVTSETVRAQIRRMTEGV